LSIPSLNKGYYYYYYTVNYRYRNTRIWCYYSSVIFIISLMLS